LQGCFKQVAVVIEVKIKKDYTGSDFKNVAVGRVNGVTALTAFSQNKTGRNDCVTAPTREREVELHCTLRLFNFHDES